MRKVGVLLWREIEDAIARDISEGTFQVGSRLPTEEDLAARFGVNRHTLRRALASLQERGTISIEQGRGTFVLPPRVSYPIGRRTRFTEIMNRHHRVSGGRLIRSWEGAVSDKIARDLQVNEQATCVGLDDVREIDGDPVSLTTRYFPADRFRGIAEVFARTQSISRSLQHFGVSDFVRRSTRVHARGATNEESSALRIQVDAAVLVVEAVNVDLDGRPVEVGISRSAGGRFELSFEH